MRYSTVWEKNELLADDPPIRIQVDHYRGEGNIQKSYTLALWWLLTFQSITNEMKTRILWRIKTFNNRRSLSNASTIFTERFEGHNMTRERPKCRWGRHRKGRVKYGCRWRETVESRDACGGHPPTVRDRLREKKRRIRPMVPMMMKLGSTFDLAQETEGIMDTISGRARTDDMYLLRSHLHTKDRTIF